MPIKSDNASDPAITHSHLPDWRRRSEHTTGQRATRQSGESISIWKLRLTVGCCEKIMAVRMIPPTPVARSHRMSSP